MIAPLQRIARLFFFNDTATTEIYTLSLHDALPIYAVAGVGRVPTKRCFRPKSRMTWDENTFWSGDRKSTRLNSSHQIISYAVFCLKKKRQTVPPAKRQRREHGPSHQRLPNATAVSL